MITEQKFYFLPALIVVVRTWTEYALFQTSLSLLNSEAPCSAVDVDIPGARTRINTNPNGIEAKAAGRNIRACVARESKLDESRDVRGCAMRLMAGRGVGECGS
jgi:hypothetical protein